MPFDGQAADFQPAVTVDPLTITDPRERLVYLRGYLARSPDAKFSMLSYFGLREEWGEVRDNDADGTNAAIMEGSCGSCACLAGSALFIFAPDEKNPVTTCAIRYRAAQLLGLTNAAADRLFEPNNHDDWFQIHGRLERVTKSQALAVLDHLIATGKVDWSLARVEA